MKSIRFKFEGIPPSVNNIYFTRGRMRSLTKAGKQFKNSWVSNSGGADIVEFMAFEPDEDTAYGLTMVFYLDRSRLFNKSFGKRKGTKRFKKMDVSNLIKLTEDAIAELLGIPDQNNFSVAAHKRIANGAERVVAVLTPLDLDDDPLAK
jgi:hypothetical protein